MAVVTVLGLNGARAAPIAPTDTLSGCVHQSAVLGANGQPMDLENRVIVLEQAGGGGGADPWTYRKVATQNFATTSNTAQDVTGLSFAVSANTSYEFEAVLMLRTATATVNPRVGLAWATGLTDGVAQIMESQAATGTPLFASGNPNAALLVAVGGLPNTTQSWPATIKGMCIAGASPGGTMRVQLASETNGTSVSMVVGSFLRYRST